MSGGREKHPISENIFENHKTGQNVFKLAEGVFWHIFREIFGVF